MATEDTTMEGAEMMENEGRIYEIGLHLVPLIADEQLAGEFGKVRDLITKAKGEVIEEAMPKMMDLSYEIAKTVNGKKHRFMKAYFGWIKFEVNAEAMPAIEAALKANEHVLRFLTIKTVRESTLAPMEKKAAVLKPEGDKIAPVDAVVEEKKEKAPVTEAELDKTIDSLLG